MKFPILTITLFISNCFFITKTNYPSFTENQSMQNFNTKLIYSIETLSESFGANGAKNGINLAIKKFNLEKEFKKQFNSKELDFLATISMSHLENDNGNFSNLNSYTTLSTITTTFSLFTLSRRI